MPDRKTNRIRIDAILNAIRKGEYDDKLPDIRAAVDARLEHKRKEVLSLVQEVYGEGYTVISKRSVPVTAMSSQRGNTMTIESAGRGPVVEDDAPVTDPLGPEPQTPPIPQAPEGPDDRGIESRSPIIGPHNPD